MFMLNVPRLRQRPRQFARLVGLSVSQFDELLEAVRPLYEAHETTRLCARPRKRALGGGRNFALSLPDRLLATLLYYRLHLTGFVLECLFDVNESNLWRERTQRMQPVLLQVLPLPMQNHLLSCLEPKRGGGGGNGEGGTAGGGARKRIGTLTELLESYPELRDICIDGTEQKLPKPREGVARRQRYSGKSHAHTVKTQITSAKRLILHLMGNTPGNLADTQLLKASHVIRSIEAARSPDVAQIKRGERPAVAKEVHQERRARRVRLDRGYAGIAKTYGGTAKAPDDWGLQNTALLVSIKGGSRHKITALGKAWNRAMVSPLRMQVEQNIGHLKNWRVLSGVYRAEFFTHQETIALVAGLHNFRILGSLNWEK